MKYTEEILTEAVNKNVSVAGVLRSLNISATSGGAHSHISKRIKHFKIKTSHFLGIRANSGKHHKSGIKKLNAKDILVERFVGNKQKTHLLKRALLEIGRKEECVGCNIKGFWNNKSLTLQIDHINGNGRDDRAENLRFLCPNCHSQTKTYARIKNTAVIRFCALCEIKIYRRSKTGYCHRCRYKAR